MKKRLLAGIALLLSSGVCAQNYNAVRRMEYEVGIGLNKGHGLYGTAAKPRIQLYAEIRMNMKDSPFDIGLQGMLGYFERQRSAGYFGWQSDSGWSETIRSKSLVTCADYNLRRWKNIAPFVGLGIGMSAIEDEYGVGAECPERYYDTAFVLNPRIGAEFFNHLRITVEYKRMQREYSFFGFDIGVVFGGGYKKPKK